MGGKKKHKKLKHRVVPDVLEQVATTTAAIVPSSAVALAADGPVGLAIATVLFTGALGFALKAGLAWKTKEAERWWDAVCEGDREAFEAKLDARRDEPHVRETVLRSVRTLLDATDPASTVPLGRLSRWYLDEQRTPDAFFRGAARLLAEANAEELADLRQIVAYVLTHLEHDRCTLAYQEGPNGEPPVLHIEQHLPQDRYLGVMKRRSWRSAASAERAFELLDQSGLGRSSRKHGQPAGEVRRTVAESLHRLLRPSEA